MKKVASAERSQETPMLTRPRIFERAATRPMVMSGTLSL